MTDDELDRMLEDLPREAEVPAQLEASMWNEIEPHMETDRLVATRALLVAAVALLLSAGGLLTMMPAPSAATPCLASLPRPPATPCAGLLPAEGDLRAAVTDLEHAYFARRDALDPAVIAIYDENLELVGEAVERSRAALAEHPGDPHLQRMLRHAYDQQLALLSLATEPTP